MSFYISGFIVALVLAALVIIWIAYCMFIRERHKSEFFQRNISDLKRSSHILDEDVEEEPTKTKKEMAVGVFILPSPHKQKNEGYHQRPDFPESAAPRSRPSTDKLINILDNDADADVCYRDGIYEVDSCPPCHSEV